MCNGTDNSKAPEDWDLSALKGVGVREGWSIPPESIMVGFAAISKRLLDIDPGESSEGIVLHVVRETPAGVMKEWLQWGKEQTFVQFMQDILYKIDGDAIAIYPGDYVCPSSRRLPVTVSDFIRRSRTTHQTTRSY